MAKKSNRTSQLSSRRKRKAPTSHSRAKQKGATGAQRSRQTTGSSSRTRARRTRQSAARPRSSASNGQSARTREESRDTPRSAVAILKRDHRNLQDLLEQLQSSQSPNRREELLTNIETEVQRHSRVEEEIFYPAFKDATGKKQDEHLFLEALEEHHVVDLVLPEIKREEPASDAFAAKAKVLKDLIDHHIGEEQDEMFPRLRQAMSVPKLEQLGDEIERRKAKLASSWNPLKAVTALVTGAGQ